MNAPATPGLDELCPRCGIAVGDHTIRGWGDCCEASGLDLRMPYTEFEGGPIRIPAFGERIAAGEIHVKAGALDSALGRLPVVVFSFNSPGAKPMERVGSPEYALVLDERGMLAAKQLVNHAINGAIREARR